MVRLRRRTKVCAFVLCLVGAVTFGCQGAEDTSDDPAACAALVDHLVELELDQETDPVRVAEREKHQVILENAIKDRVTSECMSAPTAYRDCALRATSAADLAHCR